MAHRERTFEELTGVTPPKKAGRKPGDGGRAATPTRDRLNEAQATLAEIRARKLSGELVAVADVQREWQAILIDLRAGMLAVADRVGARLGDLTPTHLAIIDQEIRAALSTLAQGGKP